MRGSCLCGDVQFEIDKESVGVIQCHCSLCRKQGGTVSNSACFVPNEQFRWLSGEDRIGRWRKASGFRSEFCANCGSPVPNPLGDSDNTWVPVGLIDGEPDLTIVAHIYTGSKANWETTVLDGECFDEMPGIDRLLALMHGD